MGSIPHEAVVARIRSLPDRPGIYIFRDEKGKPLYVGKAISLRKRTANYLRPQLEARLIRMLAEARELDFLVADSEGAALALENSWIKREKPRYNIRLRDDKTYPYLKLTAQPYPRLVFTRRIRDDGADYFGPYLPAGIARRAIKLVQKLFQIRVCHIPIDGSLPRPCLYHGMRRCLGPCVDGLTSQDAYAEAAAQARLFLSGRNKELLRRLERDMQKASNALDFEEAARIRDLIVAVREIGQRRTVASTRGEDVDVYGVYSAAGNAALTTLVMRGGQVLDRRELFWEGGVDVEPAVLLDEVLPQIYDRTTFIPKEIHLPTAIEDEAALTSWLSDKKGERVYLRMPARGVKFDRVNLAMRNAEMAYRRRFRSGTGTLASKGAIAARAIAHALDLAEPPERIEGFDISTFHGSDMVASMVVWESGRMRKSDYRSFNITGLDQTDDFAAMQQAVTRRYRRVLEETGAMPDLILIDGGRGQLGVAYQALVELGVEETPLVALAKQEEELYLVATPEPLRLSRRDPALQTLQVIRDESHRFAVDRHRRRRQKRTFTSRLDKLHGVGPTRRRALIRQFGSATGVARASREELAAALGANLGASVYDQLRAQDAEAEGPPLPEAGDPAIGSAAS